MFRVIKPPSPLILEASELSVFLAGSIEMGAAEDWQTQVEAALADLPVVILNPRRDDWDSTWKQSIIDERFREQVEWEFAAQERADLIGMYFAPETKAPVTLLELGLFARSGKLVVCCPNGFWRKGNVEIVCARYRVPLVTDFDALVSNLREAIASRRIRTGLSGS
jgi:hypothetical protein